MFCTKCGKEIIANSSFCQHCGNSIGGSNSQTISSPETQKRLAGANKGVSTTTKILKMVGATILLLIVVQYLVSILTAIFVAIFGANTEQSYTNVRAIAILISFGAIIFLWIKGYKSIFKK